jgi:hypothetical protein
MDTSTPTCDYGGGQPTAWQNRSSLKSRFFQQGSQRMCELLAAPAVPILYTTDGSTPGSASGIYADPFAVPDGTICGLAVGEKDGIRSEMLRADVPRDNQPVTIDPTKPATWRRTHWFDTTKESYGFLPLDKIYHYNPVPDALTDAEAKHVLGVQAQLWSGYMKDYRKDDHFSLNLRQLLAGESKVTVETGGKASPSGDRLEHGVLEVSSGGASPWAGIGTFRDGKAEGTAPAGTTRIRIRATEPQQSWLILEEIKIE